ncbi:GGDEF domain-containing protein [Nocardioides panacis]|uniref:GGDEF domain-containing protein n=1 Tax=Nocardioides panacis TaxID=2849501 RepID=A0A975SYP4_9ACTN|nr:GGDEF domain-containing protein [Nocardioides panacis]QWZ07668.1 GGDEF domain-containing protein [Nocardioides panacis]
MRAWVLVAVATLLGVAFVGVLRVPGLGETPTLLISNGGQLLAAVLASAGCAAAARRTHGQRRRAWGWLSAGTASWAAGQAVWSYYEVVLDRPVPFPSPADVGFLGFPLLAAVGLVIWLGSQTDELVARGRDLLDGLIIAGSLVVISWVTALGSVVAEGGDGWLPLTLSLAYPVGDLILATLVLLALSRGSRAERTSLVVLALGLGGLAIADSSYVYLVSLEKYSSADTISTGWVIGFLLVAAAGLTVRPAPDDASRHMAEHARPTVVPVPSVLGMALPYVPLLGAVAALIANRVTGARTPTMNLVLGSSLIIVVLIRQFLAMTDNRRLLVALGEARDQLEYQALHDALTGLANRVLFADRLDRALLQPGAAVSVLFCDLDDFKLVNDERGHEAGDVLLREVAHRLLDCVRATDTVARLGGDEFAILLEDSSDAAYVADRVVGAMRRPVSVDGREVRTSISVGVAHHEGGGEAVDERREPGRRAVEVGATVPAARRESTAQLLLRTADAAMYAAKGAGKARAVLAAEPTGARS